MQAGDGEGAAVLRAACCTSPDALPLGPESEWQCTQAYPSIFRLSLLLSLTGEPLLVAILTALAAAYASDAPLPATPAKPLALQVPINPKLGQSCMEFENRYSRNFLYMTIVTSNIAASVQ